MPERGAASGDTTPGAPAPGISTAEALTPASIRAHLTTRWLARELEVLEETDSTNRVVSERAASGAVHGSTVIAEEQTAGRGRHGRSFFSPARRNLYTSTLLRPADGRALAATSVLAAGVAVAEAVAAEVGDLARVSIKWPNDVQIDGLKTSGILMESIAGGTTSPAAVLGIGVNLNLERAELPDEFRARATSLAASCGRTIDRARFAARLYGTLETVLDLHASQGFEPIREQLQPFFRMDGETVRVTDLDGVLRTAGVVLGIGADGSLRIRSEDGGEERVLAGDVTIAKEDAA